MKIFHIYQKKTALLVLEYWKYIYLIFDNKYIFLKLSKFSLSEDICKLPDMSASALVGARMLKEYVIRECKKKPQLTEQSNGIINWCIRRRFGHTSSRAMVNVL